MTPMTSAPQAPTSLGPHPAGHEHLAIAFVGREQAALIPAPGASHALREDEIAGRTLVSLVSPGTELQAYCQERSEPAFSGYAVVMVVEAIGAAVTHLAIGQRVFIMGAHRSHHRCRAQDAVALPATLDPAIAVFCRLMSVSWSTLITTRSRPPDRVLVTGLGPVGNLAAQIFACAGYQVIAVDPQESRRTLARAHGLGCVLADIPTAAALEVALVVECSGHEQAILDGARLAAKGGEVVQVGVPWRRHTDATAHDLLNVVFHRYLNLRSGWEWEVPFQPQEFRSGSMIANLAAALAWLDSARVRVDGLATRFPPMQAQQAWQDLRHQRLGTPTMIFDWRDAALP